jgi:hypothetical protein
MPAHNVISDLSEAYNASGLLFGTGPSLPVSGYGKGAIFIDTTSGTLNINLGDRILSVWNRVA